MLMQLRLRSDLEDNSVAAAGTTEGCVP